MSRWSTSRSQFQCQLPLAKRPIGVCSSNSTPTGWSPEMRGYCRECADTAPSFSHQSQALKPGARIMMAAQRCALTTRCLVAVCSPFDQSTLNTIPAYSLLGISLHQYEYPTDVTWSRTFLMVPCRTVLACQSSGGSRLSASAPGRRNMPDGYCPSFSVIRTPSIIVLALGERSEMRNPE